MSRVGKVPVKISDGINVEIKKNEILISGKGGKLNFVIPENIKVKVDQNEIIISRKDDNKETRSLHGTVRSIIANMTTGVSEGFQKKLEIIGVGYRVQIQGKKIILNLGFSHPVEIDIPEGILVSLDEKNKNIIIISGIDKQKVGQFAANVKKWRKPEPYKGKGIRYSGEFIARKAGKTAKK